MLSQPQTSMKRRIETLAMHVSVFFLLLQALSNNIQAAMNISSEVVTAKCSIFDANLHYTLHAAHFSGT